MSRRRVRQSEVEMGRRKSRKNADFTQHVAAHEPAGAELQPDGQSMESRLKESAASIEANSRKRMQRRAASAGGGARMVQRSTCIAGMVLSLILGLYLGTLLPGVFQDMRGQGAQVQSVQAQGASAAPQGLPRELAARLATLEDAVRKEPGSAANWTELGNLYFDSGKVTEAINAYERSLALSPGNPDVLTDLGIMYRENKAPQKAVDCFRKALSANPRHENALFNSGVVLYNDLGRKDEAVAAWRKLLALNPNARTPDGHTVLEMVQRLEDPRR